MKRALLAALLLLATGWPACAEPFDHDFARMAAQRGDIRPLREILAQIDDRSGHVVRVRLERHEARWLYHLRLVDRQGRLSEMAIDAISGAVVHD